MSPPYECHGLCSAGWLPALAVLLCIGCGASTTPTASTASEAASESAETAPVPAAAAADSCDALIADANQAYGNDDAETALTLLDTAWAKCGDGHDILEMKAVLVAVGGDREGAAELVLQEIAEPPFSEGAFTLLGQLMPSLEPATQTRIRALGNTPEQALHAPSMRAEYTWATDVVCAGQEPESFGQGTMQFEGSTIELLTFDCPGGESHDVYFHPPPDPLEQMFEERIGE